MICIVYYLQQAQMQLTSPAMPKFVFPCGHVSVPLIWVIAPPLFRQSAERIISDEKGCFGLSQDTMSAEKTRDRIMAGIKTGFMVFSFMKGGHQRARNRGRLAL
jgi:hypothetical protein